MGKLYKHKKILKPDRPNEVELSFWTREKEAEAWGLRGKGGRSQGDES